MTGNNNIPEEQKTEKNSNDPKNWESIRTGLAMAGAVFITLLVGMAISALIFPSVLKLTDDSEAITKLVSYKMITTVMLLGIFLFTLARFFETKKVGFGRFNTSTLVIILSLMVTTVVLLIDDKSSDDVIKIIFAVIGFAGGLFAGKDSEQ